MMKVKISHIPGSVNITMMYVSEILFVFIPFYCFLLL